MKEINIYLGLKDKFGHALIKENVIDFLNKTIRKIFNSYTILEGTGMWGTVEEPMLIIQIVGPITDVENIKNKLSNISLMYCEQFNQEAVLNTIKDIEIHMFYKN